MFFKLLKSFSYASEGIVYTIFTQRNMKIHIFVTHVVILLGMAFHFQKVDGLFVMVAIGLVLGAEIMNTAIEKTVDLITSEYHPLAKTAKDLAAGGVLLMTFVAISGGIIVIYPYLSMFFYSDKGIPPIDPFVFFVFQGFYVIIFTYTWKAIMVKISSYQTHLGIGILIYLSTLFYVIGFGVYYYLMIFTAIITIFLIFRKKLSILGLLQNMLISIGVFYFTYWLFY